MPVDANHSLIVEQHVTNAWSDIGLLAPTASAAMDVLGVDRIDAAVDMGYHKGEDIEACEAAYGRPTSRTVIDTGNLADQRRQRIDHQPHPRFRTY